MILVTTVGRCFCVARSVTEDDVPAQGNATLQARREAGARYERTLYAVACKRLLGRVRPTALPGEWSLVRLVRRRAPARQDQDAQFSHVASFATSKLFQALISEPLLLLAFDRLVMRKRSIVNSHIGGNRPCNVTAAFNLAIIETV